ncbi:hypothetical protein [[Clostridium] aminophilum]|uniref:hypothetical protein n=1 Tax=[Clostridium] aminophilum TaxID=1526 RepID=UPI0015A54EA1|nr:hypothetical protein [[Clostridium] aminophilum]
MSKGEYEGTEKRLPDEDVCKKFIIQHENTAKLPIIFTDIEKGSILNYYTAVNDT